MDYRHRNYYLAKLDYLSHNMSGIEEKTMKMIENNNDTSKTKSIQLKD